MAKKLTYKSKVYKGQLIEIDPLQLQSDLKQFEGLEVTQTIELSGTKRTTKANAYLFGVVYKNALEGLIESDNEYSVLNVNHIHKMMKKKFDYLIKTNTFDIVDIQTGEVLTVEEETTITSSKNFSKYVSAIIDFCVLWLNVPFGNFDTEFYKKLKDKDDE